ncbi:DUF6414 family protein [Nakamurella aerolata]|uniref:Uncharacterized protein n=1 Tax=Nakamurella aerolata TaxID=1656892 RepID=A0A849A1K8_9ACTN|nr:hypothetical protein [Nakamurella aerolata]NNG34924.1 hypothetical protein [Nakamurella aerolata]
MNESALTPPFIREFIYVDVDRARVLLSQLAGSVRKGFKLVDGSTRDRSLGVGRATYLRGGDARGSEEEHSVEDGLVSDLEEALDVNGALSDISVRIDDPDDLNLEKLAREVLPGSVVRLTALGQMFDATYVAESLAAIMTAAAGISAIAGPRDSRARSGKPGGAKQSRDRRVPEGGQLEDLIPMIDNLDILEGLDTDSVRAIVKTTRGIFPAGLHLVFSSQNGRKWSALARLQKDRKYLDAEPEILFSRYGTGKSLWTVLGTVGHFAASRPPDMASPQADLVRDDKSVDRASFVAMVNGLIGTMASLGFSSTASYPGVSIVPVAVYRSVEIGGASI